MDYRNFRLKIHPEKPISINVDKIFENDTLNFEPAVEKLFELIRQIETPFSLGIYGDWGSGKTSLMKMLQALLDKDNDYITYWFDAWEYENEETLLIPLISKMTEKFIKHEELIKTIRKTATAALLTMSDMALKYITMNSTSVEDIKKNLETVDELFEQHIIESDKLKRDFKRLVDQIRESNKTLVIFIDDLDRCLPENCVRLLENIKHFLSQDGCVFILGVDRNVISRSIITKYNTDTVNGNEYLEKLINLSFSVPSIHDKDLTGYIAEIFVRHTNSEMFKHVESDIKFLAVILSAIGIQNPRKYRVIILRYLMFLAIPQHKQYVKEIILKLVVYREFFREAYDMKQQAEDVDFRPSRKEGGSIGSRNLTYSEIEELSCEDFAIILTEDRYAALRGFSSELYEYVQRLGDSNREFSMDIRDERERKAVQEMLDKGYKTNNNDYFQMVEFLFSLS